MLSNRVHWAKTYLKKAGLIAQPARGRVRITPEGTTLLARNPDWLAGLMIDHNISVAVACTFVIKRIDIGYFLDDEV